MYIHIHNKYAIEFCSRHAAPKHAGFHLLNNGQRGISLILVLFRQRPRPRQHLLT